MALSDNRRLFDLATRLQIYTEGVKVDQSRQFNSILLKVRDNLTKNLGRVKYKTLDGLSKAELNKLILSLRESQFKVYSEYTTQILEQLKEFMSADLAVNRQVFVTAFQEEDDEDEEDPVDDDEASKFILSTPAKDSHALFGVAAVTGNDERLWSQILNQPIPANGLYLLPFIKTFTTSAQASIENIIRKAWANRQSVDETLTELIGDGAVQGTPSQLQRIAVQAQAVVHTSFAHVAAIASVAVTSTLFGRYGWYSVMDQSTTAICSSRNLQIFRYGDGPLPPAHIRCRSHTAPVASGSDLAEETFYTWMTNQPDDVQDDMLGEDDAEDLRDGTTKAKDMPKYEKVQPLTLDEFRKKVKLILKR